MVTLILPVLRFHLVLEDNSVMILKIMSSLVMYNMQIRVRSTFEFQVWHSNKSTTLTTDQKYTSIFYYILPKL